MLRAAASISVPPHQQPGLDDPSLGESDPERHIEDWLVCYLDDRDPSPNQLDWHESIADSPLFRRGGPARPRKKAEAVASEGWSKIRPTPRKAACLVRLVHTEFLRETDIDELAQELRDLLDAGHRRIVLSFSGVERLSSLIVGELSRIRQHCDFQDGGAFRLCRLDPIFAEFFAEADPRLKAAIYPDEAAALESPWPASTGRKALPLTILAALTYDGETINREASEEDFEWDGPSQEPDPRSQQNATNGDPTAWLISERGSSLGRAISLNGSELTIGRDPSCEVRCGCASVSRLHVRIERRSSGLVLRDLHSTNGTIVDGELLKGEERLLQEGSRIEVGPLRFRVEFSTRRDAVDSLDDLVANWLQDDGAEPTDLAIPLRHENSEPEEFLLDGTSRIRYEVIEGVLIVTPRVPDLDTESNVAPLRAFLADALGQNLPRRVVIDLVNVSHLSSLALGVIVAHHLRLRRAGGGLRVGQAHARIVATLEQARLPMLIECFASLDESVISAWH